MPSKLENIKKLGNLTLSQMRSYGTPAKVSPNQVKIGDVKSGLYYDKDLPFLQKKLYTTSKGEKSHKYKLRSQGPEDLVTVSTYEGGKRVAKHIKRKDARKVIDSRGNITYRSKTVGLGSKKTHEVIIPLLKRIVANPGEFGLKGTTQRNTPDILPIVNKELVKAGYDTTSPTLIQKYLRGIQGKQIADIFKGTAREKELHNFLREINPKTGKPRFHTIVLSDIQADPRFKDLSRSVISESRLRGKLNRPVEPGYKEQPLINAQRRIKNKLKEKYPDMSKEEIAAYNEQARILLNAPEHSASFSKRLYNEKYTDEDLDIVIRFIERTDMPLFRSGQHPEMEKYMTERAINQLRSALSGETYTMGHTRRQAGDTWWLSGLEPETMAIQKGLDNLAHLRLDTQFQAAIKRGDMKTAEEAYRKMVKKGIRSSMVDEFGEQIFYGASRQPGKMAEGGIVNGYNKGGSIKKLLDDTLGMMSRRKFLKGTGATALSTVLPKSALKLAPTAIKKGALNFAPPWVNGMLSALKDVPTTANTVFRMGNNSHVQKIGSNKIKLFGGKTGTESHFRIKSSDMVEGDKIAGNADDFWDDIVLREEPGETTITWKNKHYDHGNDQHIVIDKVNKETRFVDDNWHMEAGGEDIAKDDWIEWSISPKAIEKNMLYNAPNKADLKINKEWLQNEKRTGSGNVYDYHSVEGMDNTYSDVFKSYVDSFSPSGNVFGTVGKMRKKNINKMQKKLDDEMKWEGQFRGGQGIHAYNGGGSVDFLRGRKDDEIMARMMVAEQDRNFNDARKIAHVINNRTPYVNRGTFSAHPDRSLSNVARIVSGPNQFTPFHSNVNKRFYSNLTDRDYPQDYYLRSLDYARKVLGGSEIDPTGGATFFDKDPKRYLGNEDYTPAWDINNPNTMKNTGHYFWKYNPNKMADGGIARRPNAVPPEKGPDPYGTLIDESVTQIMNNPSEYMGSQFIQKFNKGGFVKKNAPKVLGKLTNYKPKLTMSNILKNIQKAKTAKPSNKPWAVFDETGQPIIDFKIKKDADTWLKQEKGSTPAGDDYYTKTLNYKVGKKTISEETVEEPGAMFWGSREKIIGAPSEAMTGTQWLQYMKIGKHGILNPKGYPRIKDMELNDTSLAPWLSRMGNKTVSKESLVKQFDEMSPTMDVTVLGETTGSRIISDLSRKLKEVDTQAIRNPAIKGFFDYVKAVMPQLKESTTDDAAKGILKGIDDMVFNNFGVKDALTEGVPQRFPFEMKEVLQQLSTGLGKRTAGFKTYKRAPQHRGTQMMEGGDNYREFLFKYKPGSLRDKEPEYKYAHDFNLGHSDRVGGVVHARTSDRADQFGRRLLHIEEIQSDMHQKINMAQRKLKRMHADWAKAGKTPEGEYKKMSERQQKDYDELVAKGKYAPRGDLKEEVATANEQHLLLVKSKIEDLLSQKQTAAIKTRITRLNNERKKVRKIIEDEKKKMAKGDHSGVPQGPFSKTEDYNEFIMKYMLKVAREGGYDGITINTAAIKNKGLSPTNQDFKGNLVAYGPMAKGAMEKAAKKSGAKFMKTYIVDENKRVWEVPMILIKENKAAQALIDKGLPIYKRGGIVKK